MSDITIRHTHAEGTLIEGSAKGDGVWEVLKAQGRNWRYFRSLGQIGLGQSRDKAAKTWIIEPAAKALREAGHEVTVEIDESQRRDMATIEAERAERAEVRAERYEERAEKRGEQANADYARARQMAEAIPFGQPILTDHYSAGRDRRYRDRIHNTYGRAFEGMDEAKELGRRAEAAQANQSHRESVPATLRRIEKLEADLRGVRRNLDGRLDYVSDGSGGYALKRVMPSEGRKARLEQMAADLQEQITYWRGHVAKAEANGVKVWSREDFTKGDFALTRWGWVEVLRVNAKSLTHPWGANAVHLEVVTRDNVKTALGTPGWTDTATYDEVRGRKSAEEMAEILAKAELASA
jgi:Domain of unknown function (DUF3560)